VHEWAGHQVPRDAKRQHNRALTCMMGNSMKALYAQVLAVSLLFVGHRRSLSPSKARRRWLGPGSQYGRLFDPKTVETVTGESRRSSA